jgi:hypothetical protein
MVSGGLLLMGIIAQNKKYVKIMLEKITDYAILYKKCSLFAICTGFEVIICIKK